MPDLQIDTPIALAVQLVKDATGGASALALGQAVVGIGAAPAGKELEVVGDVAVRHAATIPSAAIGFSSHEGGLGSVWTNNSYDPGRPTKNWQRTINLLNGNVGLGRDVQAPDERLVVDGSIKASGDILLSGSDCAEEFAVTASNDVDEGTVLVIGQEERLCRSDREYDRRVAGVVSGAGACKPAIILGRIPERAGRLPIALTGTVYCKVDAAPAAIEIGDLLTTSSTPGHAMKAVDRERTPGAVLGKAMRPLARGRALIPILVALQ